MIFTGDELLRGDIVNTNQAYLGQRLLDLGIFATHARLRHRRPGRHRHRHPGRLAAPPGGAGALRRPRPHRGRPHPRGHRRGPRAPPRAPRGPARGDPGAVRRPGLHDGREQPQAGPTAAGSDRHPPLGHGPRLLCWSTRGRSSSPSPASPGSSRRCGRGPSSRGWPPSRAARAPATPCGASARSASANRWPPRGWRTCRGGARTWRSGRGPAWRSSPSSCAVRPRPRAHGGWTSCEAKVRAALGDRVFGVDGPGLPEIAGRLLLERGLTVAVAESCTGGLVGKRFTDIPGSSDYFLGRRHRLQQRREDAAFWASRRRCWPSTAP